MISDTSGVFKTQELPPLEQGLARYIMANGGLYYEQHDELFHASTEIHHFYRDVNFGSTNLLEHEEFFKPKFPKVPEELMAQCLGFFKTVEDAHDCECGLVLLYDPDTFQYQWCCPEQEMGSADLKFTVPLPGKDYEEHWVHFGDVHLHPGMSAYHSHTDYGDEMLASDGLHLVVGTPTDYTNSHWNSKTGKYDNKKKKPAEYCATFVSDGARFKIEPSEVLDAAPPGEFPVEWLKKCKRVKKTYFGGGYGAY